jgi:hypothetical protein
LDDPITKLVKKLLAAEDVAEVQALGAQLQRAIRSHISRVGANARGAKVAHGKSERPVEKNEVKKSGDRKEKPLILSIAYDEQALRRSQVLLESNGYRVIGSVGLSFAVDQCKKRKFDALVVGRSVPSGERAEMVKTVRELSSAPIISVHRNVRGGAADGADYSSDSNTDAVLKVIERVVRGGRVKP